MKRDHTTIELDYTVFEVEQGINCMHIKGNLVDPEDVIIELLRMGYRTEDFAKIESEMFGK